VAAIPQTVYARDGDTHLAYQVVADGGSDLLFVPTATFPIDLLWDEPTVARHLRRLASFSRLIRTDLLGMGSSDAVPIQDRPAMQAWTDGFVAVLDAVGSECASVFAVSESALPAMLLAATHPQRARSLVLWSPYARFLRADDYPCGMPEPAFSRYVDAFGDTVGTGAVVDELAPSWAGDAGKRRWWARGERLAAGPGYFKAIFDLYLRTDVRRLTARPSSASGREGALRSDSVLRGRSNARPDRGIFRDSPSVGWPHAGCRRRRRCPRHPVRRTRRRTPG
jgi:pimeloyl-ACP methyl ester carboxylesterase